MRLLLITGGFEPYGETTPTIAKCLRGAGHTVRVTKSARELATPTLSGYDAIVLNTWRRNWFAGGEIENLRRSYPRGEPDNDLTEAQRVGLQSFVQNGGGLISLHLSPDSCPDWPEMKKLTGGGWVSGVSRLARFGSRTFGRFKVLVTNPQHPVAAGVEDFETEDEIYCDMNLQPGIDVFLGTPYEGVERPLGWTTSYGKGRVVNLALGHSGVSVGMPLDGHAPSSWPLPLPITPFQRLLLNAVDYVTR